MEGIERKKKRTAKIEKRADSLLKKATSGKDKKGKEKTMTRKQSNQLDRSFKKSAKASKRKAKGY